MNPDVLYRSLALPFSITVEASSFTIYMISQILKPPGTSVEKIETSAKRSTFLAAAYASEMTKKLRSTPSTTIIVPRNNGFEKLGLLTDYLLLSDGDSRKALKKVIQHHMLRGVYYTADLGNDTTRTIPTHEGSSIVVHEALEIRESGLWNRTTTLVPQNEITQTGVVHEVQDVLLPESLKVGLEDLARAAGGDTMITLIKRAGLGKLLNGTLTMEDIDELDDWKRTHAPRHNRTRSSLKAAPPVPLGWTLLCPKDSAFNNVNLTRLLNDPEALRALVLQHVIPTPTLSSTASSSLDPEFPLSFADDATYNTLLSPNSLRADIVFRVTSKSPNSNAPKLPGHGPHTDLIVGIKGARGGDGLTDFARVLNFGRTTIPAYSPSGVDVDGLGPRSGVLQIDRVLQPWVPDWWNAWGWAVAFGAVGCTLITAFWGTVLFFWHRKSEEATYEPLDGDGTGEDDYE